MDRYSSWGGTGIKYHGLAKKGATSHLNSVLQVLFMTKDFRQAVQRHSHDAQSLDSCLKSLFDELRNQPADTSDIIKRLDIRSVNDHGDAAECFENILSSLSCPEASQLFKGVVTHKYKCARCRAETGMDNSFWSIPLEMSESYKDYKVVYDVNKFFTETDVTGSNQVFCDTCADKSDATVKYEVKHHPEVLTLQLKKLKFDQDLRKCVKNYCNVQIPFKLQLPHKEPQSQMYELYAFVEHFDFTTCGYHTVTIKSQEDGKWYKFSDYEVSQLYWQADINYRSRKACLLFYRKIPSSNTFTQDISETSTSEASKQDTRERKKQHSHGVKAREEKKDEGAADVKLYSVDTQRTDENKRPVNDRDGGTSVDKQRHDDEMKTEQNITGAQKMKDNNPCINETRSDGGESTFNTLTQNIRHMCTSGASKQHHKDKAEQRGPYMKTRAKERDEEAAGMNCCSGVRQETENRAVTFTGGEERGTAGEKQRDDKRKTTEDKPRAGNLKIFNLCNDQITKDGRNCEGTVNSWTEGSSAASTSKASMYNPRDTTVQRHYDAKTREGKAEDCSTERSKVSLSQSRSSTVIRYHGLSKKGAISYLNSVLQVLFMTEDFRDAVQRHSCDVKSLDRNLRSLFEELKRHPADTSDIMEKLGIKSVDDQGNAAECFENILSRVSSPEASQLFCGWLANKCTCSTCGTETSTDQPFWTFPLTLAESNRDYCVADEVNKFFTESVASGPNQLYCNRCSAKSDATMKAGMKHHPEVLTLQLKKLKFDHYLRKWIKIDCSVQIPSTLQLPHKGAQSQMYELYAFVDHFDYTTWGYHTVTIKSQEDGKWYKFDDSEVTPVNWQPFQADVNDRSRKACLLFYRKTPSSNTFTQDISETSTSEVSKQDTREIKEQHSHGVKAREEKKDEGAADVKLYSVDTQKTDENKRPVNDRDGGTSVDKQRHEDEMKTEQNRTEAQKMKDNDRSKGSSTVIRYHGLFTKGATSYLNCVLQVLFMTKAFREAVQRHSCDVQSLDGSLKTFFDELEKYSADTSIIIEKLGIRSVDDQGDAAECYENIMSTMSCTEASQLFQGELMHTYKCSKITCGKKTVTDIPVWSLSLEMMASHGNYNVVDEVNRIFTESRVSGSNQQSCDRCASKSDATLRTEMKHHPEILTLQLKKLNYDYHRKKHVKPSCTVQIPSTLQIPHDKEQSPVYELYAFVECFDYMCGSHAVTIKSENDGKWYKFKDNVMKSVQLDIKHEDAYLLFYRKISSTSTWSQDGRKTSTSEASTQDTTCKKEQHDHYGKSRGREGKEETAAMKHNSLHSQKTDGSKGVVNVGDGGSSVEEQRNNSDICSGGQSENAASTLTQDLSAASTSENDFRNKTVQHDHDGKTPEKKVCRKRSAGDLGTEGSKVFLSQSRSSTVIKYHGLPRKGETSYLNSVLQVLFMSKDFREAVQRHTSDVESFDGSLKSLFDELKNQPADTSDIIEKLGLRSVKEQGDAAECFVNILRSVRNTEASQLFQGVLMHKYNCSACGTDTSTGKPVWSLPLELEESYSSYSVVDVVNKFFSESDVSEPNQLCCNVCAGKSEAAKVSIIGNIFKWRNPFTSSCSFPNRQKFEMKHCPMFLMLHLKRFKFDQKYQENLKNSRIVEIHQTLEIPQSEAQSQKYELYAFVEHIGGVRYGHYSVKIKSKDNGRWYKFKDTFVTWLQYCEPFQSDIKYRSSDAYLLFYRKISVTNTSTPDISEPSTSNAPKQHTRNQQEQHGPDDKTRTRKEDEKSAVLTQEVGESKRAVYDREDRDRWKQRGIKYYGLLNQGATCYLNSVLQVLFMTRDFREAVQRNSCDAQSLDAHLNSLFEDLRTNYAYTCNITKKLGITEVHVQSDAAECLENILRSVGSHGASELFEGKLTQKYKCSTCGTETSTDNSVWSLPLEFEDSYKDYSVVDGISKYFSEADISGPNQLYCDRCAEKSDATLKAEMKHHPDVLTLLMKRFKFDYWRMTFVKINAAVQIPYTLKIPASGGQSQAYELYAYVEHFGDLRFGHYTATIRSQENGKWHHFNDTKVTELYCQPFQVDPTERSEDAYLLFYRKDINKASTSEASERDSRDEHRQRDQDVNDSGGTAATDQHSGKKHETQEVNNSKETGVEGQRDELLHQNRDGTYVSASDAQINQSEGNGDHETSKTSQEQKLVVSEYSHGPHDLQTERDRDVPEKKMRTDGDRSSGRDKADNGCDNGAHSDAVQHNTHDVKNHSSVGKCEYLDTKIVEDEEIKRYSLSKSQQVKGAHGKQQNKEDDRQDIDGKPTRSRKGLKGQDGEGGKNKNVQTTTKLESHYGGNESDQKPAQLNDQVGRDVTDLVTVRNGDQSSISAIVTQETAAKAGATTCGANGDDVDVLTEEIKNLKLNDTPQEAQKDGDKNMTGQTENDPGGN